MNFTLTISGETPAELLDTLTQLGGMTINVNTSPNGGVETHTMTAAECPKHNSPLPSQSAPVQQPDKPKAQPPPKPKSPHGSPQPPLRRSLQTLQRQKPRVLPRRRIPHRQPRPPHPLLTSPHWTRSAIWPAA